MALQKLILILVLFYNALSFGGETLSVNSCPSTQNIVIQRELPNDRTFPYTFQYRCKDPKFPIIIYIPGGPGAGSIDAEKSAFEDVNANVILTDPRGIGANKKYFDFGGKYKDLTSNIIAMDVIEIVKSFPESQRFIIYGHSYGTVVATHVGAELAKLPFQVSSKVLSFILEGTLGKSFEASEQTKEANNQLFMLMYNINLLPELDRNLLLSKLNHLKSKHYDDWLSAILAQGHNFTLRYLIDNSFNQIDQHAKFELPIDMNFYQSIACNELTPTGFTEPKIEGDYFKLAKLTEGSCQGRPLKNPFDSKNYLISKPIYYISGFQDPWTSPKQYIHHINNQTLSKKKISICDMTRGHEVVTLLSKECKQNVFEFIVNDKPITKDNCPTIHVTQDLPCYYFDEDTYPILNNQSIGGHY